MVVTDANPPRWWVCVYRFWRRWGKFSAFIATIVPAFGLLYRRGGCCCERATFVVISSSAIVVVVVACATTTRRRSIYGPPIRRRRESISIALSIATMNTNGVVTAVVDFIGSAAPAASSKGIPKGRSFSAAAASTTPSTASSTTAPSSATTTTSSEIFLAAFSF